MPELPEVETYVRELEPALLGRTVSGATVRWARTVEMPTVPAFTQAMIGRRFTTFTRRGKYMLLGLENGATLIVHLRMTGRLTVYPMAVAPDKHTHVLFDLADGGQLHFQDSRKFGRIWHVETPAAVLAKLGPEPLSDEFVLTDFAQRLAGRAASIKALLLDQSIVAGVGNIYADESLYLAGIHPARTGGALKLEEIAKLQGAIRTVLGKAIAARGSSLGTSSIQNYQRPNGEPGGYQVEHRVFQRTGQPCLHCGAPVERIVIAQRSTHFCPTCQPR